MVRAHRLGGGARSCTTIDEFRNGHGNRFLVGDDALKKHCIETKFDIQMDKGPDFLAVWNGRYVIGEAKLITDFGGHQQTQFNDAMDLVRRGLDAVLVAILDGVLYIEGGSNKMQTAIRTTNHNIMSALVFREFLDSI